MQQLLRVGPGSHADLHIISVIVKRLNQSVLVQKIIGAFVFNLYVAAAVAALDLLQGALENRFSSIDETDGTAEFLDLIHAMGREQDGAALLVKVEQHILEQDGVYRVETGEGLVHDKELRFMQ